LKISHGFPFFRSEQGWRATGIRAANIVMSNRIWRSPLVFCGATQEFDLSVDRDQSRDQSIDVVFAEPCRACSPQ
jgi:hypothetical protein